MQNDTPKASSPSSSSAIKSVEKPLGDPNCPHCGGVGYVRYDVPVGHEKFGKLEPCICRAHEVAKTARSRLFEMSGLNGLSHLTFENFNTSGNKKAEFITEQEIKNLHDTLDACVDFSQKHQGWLLLEGKFGAGKTHLVAAIANDAVSKGISTLFITVPDLLDSLRFSFDSKETTYEERFEEIRGVNLLVLDDFGTQNATPWAQEKLFQIINHRYVNKLPTVITTNLNLDDIESRIRSRLQDSELVTHVRFISPDYRRPKETGNPGVSMLRNPRITNMTFGNFVFREDELGKEVVTTVTSKQDYGYGGKKTTRIVRDTVTAKGIKSLKDAFNASVEYAEHPRGWLVLLGGSYSGKTHLSAAIGNLRLLSGGEVIMAGVSPLLDYLKKPFNENSDITFDSRYKEMIVTPLLILDDMQESGLHSKWAEDKLYQLLYQRYDLELPTVITSTMRPDEFSTSHPSLWNRILDTEFSDIRIIDMPPYRRVAKGSKAGKKK